MSLFPAFLKLADRECLVVGAGRVAEEKIAGLLRCRANVHVVAPRATRRVRAWAREKKIRWDARPFHPGDLAGAFLAVAATSSPALHAEIYAHAHRRSVLCNIADDPRHCDFYYGAVVRRGALQIAISTEGHSPALAQRLKKKIARQFGAEYKSWLAEIGKARLGLLADKKLSPRRRTTLLHAIASEKALGKFRRSKRPRK